MPRVDGLRFCKMVKSGPQKDNVYFILLTSQRKTKDKVSGFSMGADDYLTKPFDMEELMARVTTGLKIISLQKSLLNSNKILQAQNVRTMNDIQTAATIQRGLLPDEIKSIKGIKVFTKYIPCRFVGGDYFDVIETSVEGKWAIFSGDVSGHGLGATYITAMLKMSFMMNSP